MDYIDNVDTPEFLENCWVTRYFLETKDNVGEEFSTLKWLGMIDNDTLAMITEYIDKAEKLDAKFDPEKDSGGLEDIAFLIGYCAAAETGIPFGDFLDSEAHEKTHNETIAAFNVFVTLESLRRKKLVDWKGEGKITNPNTTLFAQTELGKKLQKHMGGRKNGKS